MKTKLITTIMITLFLASMLNVAVSFPTSPKIAIDVTRLNPDYKPSFIGSLSSTISVLVAEGYTVDVWEAEEITATRLDGYCTLIIVWPQAAYSSEEVTAILDFVSSGHGLLFLGDYGKAWYEQSGGVYPEGADPIIGPLGISINNDQLRDPTDNCAGVLFSPKIHIFPVAHPVTYGISIYTPHATATLTVTSPATVLATGDDDTYTADPDGTNPEGDSPSVVTGTSGSYEPVLAASTYGLGRAVVAGDHSWILLLEPIFDNIKLFVNVVKWLCPLRTIEITLDPPSGNLGDAVTVRTKVRVPPGETATIVVTLPTGFHYLPDGDEATQSIESHTITYTITEPGEHEMEFNVKVDEAKSWEDMTVYSLAVATWYDALGNIVDEKEATADFIIYAFEELQKGARPVLFSDNFNDGDYDGWVPVTGDTSWSVVDGVLHCTPTISYPRILADSTMLFTDYIFEADARVISGRGYALLFRAMDHMNFYSFQYQVGAGVQLRLYQL